MKKIFCIIIAILGFSASAYAFEAADEVKDVKLTESAASRFTPNTHPEGFSDCGDSHVNTLLRLGFISGYEDGTFRPENTLTRAEGVKLAIDCITNKEYMESLLENGYYNSVFLDVDKNHWASTYVTYGAQNLKIINGFEDGLFRTEDTLTRMQLAKMLVCALGFENEAIAEGGYPQGFKKTAEKLEIAADIEDVPITRAEAAQMIYNALLSPVNVIEGYEKVGSSIAQIASKRSMMDYIHDIRVAEGELKVADTNIVTVGDESFLMGYDDAEKFSGVPMKHFVQKNENGLEVWLAAE